jgi:predicted glycosyltransferase
MNREAAVLGVPVWSVFTGPTPAIDEQLAREGRLHWVRSEADLATALHDGFPPRREGRGPFPAGLAAIVAEIERTVASEPPVPV